MKTSPYQALQTIRRLSRELQKLDERTLDTASKRSQAEMKGVRLALARLEKTLQTEVNERKKIREVYEAQLRALNTKEK